MDKKRNVRAAEILLTAATVLLAALLVWQCAQAYAVGNAPTNRTEEGIYLEPVFSREIAAQRLKSIAWAMIVWLGAWAWAAVDRIRRPSAGSERTAPGVHEQLTLVRRWREETPETRREAVRRKKAGLAFAAVCAAAAVGAGSFFLHADHFASQDPEQMMGRLLMHATPWAAVVFAADMLRRAYSERSMRREISLLKGAPVRKAPNQPETDSRAANAVRIALYAAAFGLIAAGAANGGMRDVLVKAINICTECIGLG